MRTLFFVGVFGNDVAISTWGEGPTIVEEVGPNRYVAFYGDASATVGPDGLTAISVPFDGTIEYCELAAPIGQYLRLHWGAGGRAARVPVEPQSADADAPMTRQPCRDSAALQTPSGVRDALRRCSGTATRRCARRSRRSGRAVAPVEHVARSAWRAALSSSADVLPSSCPRRRAGRRRLGPWRPPARLRARSALRARGHRRSEARPGRARRPASSASRSSSTATRRSSRATTSTSSTCARRAARTSSWPGRRSRPASTCCARSRWPSTSARRGGPPALARSKGLKTKLGFTFRYAPVDALHAAARRRRLRRHAVHLQRLRAELAVARPDEPAAPGRSGRRSQRAARVVARRLRRADHRHLRTCWSAATSRQVVGTMRNFIPERMVRATGKMSG